MVYKTGFTKLAKKDLDEIYTYIAKDSKRYASELHNKILNSIDSLTHLPHRGASQDELLMGSRSLCVGSYFILYQVDNKNVSILRILHSSRDMHGILAK